MNRERTRSSWGTKLLLLLGLALTVPAICCVGGGGGSAGSAGPGSEGAVPLSEVTLHVTGMT